MRVKVKNLILGAGITGLSCAYHLGKDYLILERDTQIGGLAKSKRINGFIFDLSAHLLHPRTEYFKKWLREKLGRDLVLHKRNAWVYCYGVYTKYPFQANLYGLPKKIIEECLEGLLEVEGRKPGMECGFNFEDWIYKKFGPGIAKYFMIPYNEKFWTVHPKDLSCEWIDGYVPQPGPKDIIKGSFEYSKKEFGYHSRFFYPRSGGIDVFVGELARGCKEIILGEEVKEIDLSRKMVRTGSGNEYRYQRLISTIPLIELKDKILNLNSTIKKLFSKLRYLSVLNVNLGIKRENISKKDWIYFPEENFVFYRVGFPMNFAPSSTPKGFSSIYIDISYSQWKPIDKKDILKWVREDLIKAGIMEKEDEVVVKDINDIKYAYVIYDKNWKKAREGIIKYLSDNGVLVGGRFGSWRYLSMEGCFLDGKRLAEELYRA